MVSKAFNEEDYSALRDEINNDLNLPRVEDNGYRMESYLPAVDKADIIVFLVAHDEFKELKISKEKIILNFCGI